MLTLPAQVQAFQNAGIHSRVPGYLKAWYVDIGAPVKKGQLLAEVDTPDLDQQLGRRQGRSGHRPRQRGPVADHRRPLEESLGQGRGLAAGI
ncbi:MAG: biotin/lipoyl-binding protein [Caulobacteraceae bacterium]